MTNPMYDKDFRYTATATEIDSYTYHALHIMFEEFVERGFSPRDIAHVMHAAVTDLELSAVLDVPLSHEEIKCIDHSCGVCDDCENYMNDNANGYTHLCDKPYKE
jgi:hypothetical protein